MKRDIHAGAKIKKSIVKRANIWLLSELALVFLVLTVAVNYIFGYVGNSLKSDSVLTAWDYIYTNSAEPPSDNSGIEWESANSISPVKDKKTGNYLHLRGNIASGETDRTLILKTDFAPVRIFVNGEPVYDNHYGKSEYVGNAYNSVVIKASAVKTLVEISMQLPFSAAIETMLVASGENAVFEPDGRVVFSVCIIAAGILTAVISLIFAVFKKKKSVGGFAAAALFVLYGGVLAVSAIARASYIINFPEFCNISLAAELMIGVIFMMSVKRLMRIKSKGLAACFIFAALFSLGLCFVQSARMLRFAHFAAALVCAFAAAFLAGCCFKSASRRIQYASGFYIISVFFALLYTLYAIISITLKYKTKLDVCMFIGEFVLLCFISYVLFVRVFLMGSAKGVREKTKSYDKCVKSLEGVMRHILSGESEEDVCRYAVEGVIRLLNDALDGAKSGDVTYSVLKKTEKGYRSIFDGLSGEEVNCGLIESRCEQIGKNCVFDESYFDFVFLKNGDYYCIFHFENIKNGLSPFFVSIMNTVYCCIDIALESFLLNSDPEKNKIKVLTKLAHDIEAANGSGDDHLECVAYYTGIMLEKMGYDKDICEIVSKASMLHDIGKTAIPAEVTDKAGLLSEGEREIIKKHTEYGKTILSVFGGEFSRRASVIASEHHEHWDGKGCNGLSGESIDEFARVVAVADTLDALTTKRSYKEAWSFERAKDHIDSNSGTIYDPRVVSAMHECADEIRTKVSEKNR